MSAISKDRSKDAKHFKYEIGMQLGDYKVTKFIADGTFGRVLEVKKNNSENKYVIKVIRAVERYVKSAKVEAYISKYIQKHCPVSSNYFARLYDEFSFGDNYCMVYERLGMSLYSFLEKRNKFRGFPISVVQSFARQMIEAVGQMHELKLTHTDLKPENILLVESKSQKVKIQKRINYHDDESSDSEQRTTKSRSRSRSQSKSYYKNKQHRIKTKTKKIRIPLNDKIKLIDFGGATFEDEHHSSIINTRQYRAPEVTLSCCRWNEKSDIWGIACIILELYTGQLYFQTHQVYEHLAMIQKQNGSFPAHMVNRAPEDIQNYFLLNKKDNQKNGIYLNWPKPGIENQLQKIISMNTYHQLISKEHKELIQLLELMFEVDPAKRISCQDALKHQFFVKQYNDYIIRKQ